jgi:hypothetical protein
MTKIVCSLSESSVGCTFVDWSIHFLAGKDQYYSFAQQTWIDLVTNPLTDLNAHAHDRNHPDGIENCTTMIQQAKNMPDTGLYSIYPFTGETDHVRKKLKIDLEEYDEKKFCQLEQDWHADEFSKIFDYCANNSKVLFIHNDNSVNWFRLFSHLRMVYNMSIDEQAEIAYRKQSFHKKAINQWKSLGLENMTRILNRLQAAEIKLILISKYRIGERFLGWTIDFKQSGYLKWHGNIHSYINTMINIPMLLRNVLKHLLSPTFFYILQVHGTKAICGKFRMFFPLPKKKKS